MPGNLQYSLRPLSEYFEPPSGTPISQLKGMEDTIGKQTDFISVMFLERLKSALFWINTWIRSSGNGVTDAFWIYNAETKHDYRPEE